MNEKEIICQNLVWKMSIMLRVHKLGSLAWHFNIVIWIWNVCLKSLNGDRQILTETLVHYLGLCCLLVMFKFFTLPLDKCLGCWWIWLCMVLWECWKSSFNFTRGRAKSKLGSVLESWKWLYVGDKNTPCMIKLKYIETIKEFMNLFTKIAS